MKVMDKKNADYNKILPICRVCLKTSADYIDFQTPYDDEVDDDPSDQQRESCTFTYLDCFKKCTNIDVTDTLKNIKQSLCDMCVMDLKISYEFLKKSEYADRILNDTYLKLMKQEKERKKHAFLKTDLEKYVFEQQQQRQQFQQKQLEIKTVNDGTKIESLYECDKCKQDFANYSLWQLHIVKVHGIRMNITEMDTNETTTQHHKKNASQKKVNDICALDFITTITKNLSQEDIEIKTEATDSEDEQFEYEVIEIYDNEMKFLNTEGDEHDDVNADDDNDNCSADIKFNYNDRDYYYENNVDDDENNNDEMDVMNIDDNEGVDDDVIYPQAEIFNQIKINENLSESDEYEEKQLICCTCNKTFPNRNNLIEHQRKMHPTQMKECKICNESILKRKMRQHTKKQHSKIVKCTKCEHECKESELTEHNQKQHISTNKCHICSKEFSTTRMLYHHLRYHERRASEQKSPACGICGKTFAAPNYLRQHMNIHKEKREIFPCKKCNKIYMTKTSYVNHMRIHSGNTINCEYCNKKFSRQYELNIHKRFHTGNYPFSCEICNRKFAIKGHLRTHMWQHQGLKLKCDECGKLFKSNKSLNEHSFVHTEMPFPCSYCERAYPSKQKYKSHLNNVHKMELTEEELSKFSKPVKPNYKRKKLTLVKVDK